ncbi:MAG: thiamine-phosphate kinase [Thermoguttaceae bacterium]
MESELIAWLRERLPPHPLLRLGPGDDAAVLDMARIGECIVTVDLLTSGVDFVLHEVDARRVGRKALAVNLSDIAAMAGRPLAAVVALALPRKGGMRLAVELYEGLLPLAEEFDVAIAGGDTNAWDGPLAISVTMLGEVTDRGPLRRDGARPGDRILVTGSIGGSILGRHFDFQPRVKEALLLAERYQLNAGIDMSDGLSVDLSHLARESGLGAELRSDTIPIAEDAHQLAKQLCDGTTPLDHALCDGEDFELLLAVGPDEAERILSEQPLDIPIADIGHFTAQPGLRQTDAAGTTTRLEVGGWEHEFD